MLSLDRAVMTIFKDAGFDVDEVYHTIGLTSRSIKATEIDAVAAHHPEVDWSKVTFAAIDTTFLRRFKFTTDKE